jgi:fatty-acid desaturase
VAGVVWTILHPSPATLVAAAVFYVVCGLGITAGYHRLFAHRTYRTVAPVRWCLLIAGGAALENSALSWSADHRAHHADTDGAGDPHAVTRGAWYAHVGWLFRRREASADVRRLGDLWAVRSVRLQHRWYPVVAIGFGLALPTVIASWWGDPIGGLLVIGFLRSALGLQATFCVNSLAHLVGTRRFDALTSARDSVVTALVTFGEGYHNYHHRFPYDFRNGARWWHYDPSKWLIWVLARVRLATTLRTASPALVATAIERTRHNGTPPRTKQGAAMATRKQTTKPGQTRYRWQSAESPDDLGPADRIAHDILAGRRDLFPSVERIMTAGLGDDGTLRAIGLFRDSLTTPGDVNRDPRVAIATCATGADGASVTSRSH